MDNCASRTVGIFEPLRNRRSPNCELHEPIRIGRANWTMSGMTPRNTKAGRKQSPRGSTKRTDSRADDCLAREPASCCWRTEARSSAIATGAPNSHEWAKDWCKISNRGGPSSQALSQCAPRSNARPTEFNCAPSVPPMLCPTTMKVLGSAAPELRADEMSWRMSGTGSGVSTFPACVIARGRDAAPRYFVFMLVPPARPE